MNSPLIERSPTPPTRLLNVQTWQDLAHGYLDITNKLLIDFQRDLNYSVYALDFSELHLYMHRHRSAEMRDYGKFDLTYYILENAQQPDVLSILPPTVFEIMRYMIQVSEKLSRLSSYSDILKNKLIADFYRVCNEEKLSDDYSRKVLSAYRQMDGLNPMLLIATDKGFKEIIGDPLGKFIWLIQNNKIAPLDKILESFDIKEFDINLVDQNIYRELLRNFQSIRDKPVNNKVDAMVGAMIYEMCGLYYKKNKLYSNLITHSKHCLDVMERLIPSEDPLNMPIVRDPVYFLSRILCWKLTDDPKERIAILKSIQNILIQMIEANSAEELFKRLQSLEEKKNALSSAEFFERVFVYDYDWGAVFRKAYSQVHENSYVSAYLEEALKSDSRVVDLLTSQPYEDIEMLRDAFTNMKDYQEKLKKADIALRQEVERLYTSLIKFVEGFRWGELTSSQIEVFQRIQRSSIRA